MNGGEGSLGAGGGRGSLVEPATSGAAPPSTVFLLCGGESNVDGGADGNEGGAGGQNGDGSSAEGGGGVSAPQQTGAVGGGVLQVAESISRAFTVVLVLVGLAAGVRVDVFVCRCERVCEEMRAGVFLYISEYVGNCLFVLVLCRFLFLSLSSFLSLSVSCSLCMSLFLSPPAPTHLLLPLSRFSPPSLLLCLYVCESVPAGFESTHAQRHVCIYIHNTYIYINIYTYISSLLMRNAQMFSSQQQHTDAYIHIFIYICIYMCMYICIYKCIHTYIHIHIYMCVYIHVYVYIHTYIRMYKYIYIYKNIGCANTRFRCRRR